MKAKNWALIRIPMVLMGAPTGISIASDSTPISSDIDWEACLAVVVFVPLAVLLLIAVQSANPRSKPVWTKPSWKANPFAFDDHLQFSHMGAYHFMLAGVVGLFCVYWCGIEAVLLASFFLIRRILPIQYYRMTICDEESRGSVFEHPRSHNMKARG